MCLDLILFTKDFAYCIWPTTLTGKGHRAFSEFKNCVIDTMEVWLRGGLFDGDWGM